jgi:hypothetical protein
MKWVHVTLGDINMSHHSDAPDFGYFGLQKFLLPYTSKLSNVELADSRSVTLWSFGTLDSGDFTT